MPGPNDKVGNVDKMYIISMDNLENRYESNITKSKYIKVNPYVTYATLDQTHRNLITNITSNTYNDTILIKTISLNEAVAS